MITELLYVVVRAADPAKEIAFYRGVFGRKPVTESPGRLAGWDFATPATVRIEIIGGGSVQSVPSDRMGSPCTLEFRCDDLDTEVARIKELGATVIDEPFTLASGNRAAFLADPEGHVFALFQLTGPRAIPS